MVDYYLKEDELLDKEHLPVYFILHGAPDSFFPEEIRCLSMGVGFGNDAGECSFWEDLDEAEQARYGLFDGAVFTSWFLPHPVQLTNAEILHYVQLACRAYCRAYPNEKEKLDGYMKSFAKLKGLE